MCRAVKVEERGRDACGNGIIDDAMANTTTGKLRRWLANDNGDVDDDNDDGNTDGCPTEPICILPSSA